MDRNSAVNQRIKEKFVEREVITCQSSLVNMLMEQGVDGFSYDEVENLYLPKCPQCGDFNSITEEENEDGETIYKCSYCDSEFDEEPDTEPQEIYEWWLVSNWLADKLREHNQPILDNDYDIWWGRTCTGQAILLDSVISDICEEMEILEGQKYEWKI
jgi:hypothetical protein